MLGFHVSSIRNCLPFILNIFILVEYFIMPKRRSLTSNKGGSLVSSGSYGCVYSPPLPCDTEPSKKPQPTDISKIFATSEEAQSEWQKSLVLKTIDPKQTYLLYPYIQCSTSYSAIQANDAEGNSCPLLKDVTDQTARFSQLVSLNGGQPLYDYLANRFEEGNPVSMKNYLSLLEQVAKCIYVMNSKGYCHHDIKPNNILVNDQGVARLIDFGFMMQSRVIPTGENRFLKKNYWIHPPEYWVMNKKLEGNPISNLEKHQYIVHRLNQYNSVFSDKDQTEILQWYIKYWPSLCEMEQAYLKAMTGETLPMMSTPEYPLYVDVYSFGIMMMYLIQFVSENSSSDFIGSGVFASYKNIVCGAMHPNLQKRYSISKVLKLIRALNK